MSADLSTGEIPPLSPEPARPPSRFTTASWIVLLGGVGLTFVAYNIAVYFRRPGEWLPGIGEALLGFLITAIACFGCGLTALLRREPRWKLALVPFLAGLGTLGYVAWNWLSR